MPRPPTCAQRLGWDAGDRVVLFHTDDAGLLECANRGAVAALEDGVARSWSVMMPCPGVAGIAAYLARHPGTDSGVHITLTSEWPDFRWRPLAAHDPADGITAPDGAFWPDARSLARHARPEAVEREIRAQVAAADAMGLPVTHLDCHMAAAYVRPDFFEALARVGMARGVPVMAEGGPFGPWQAARRLAAKAHARLARRASFLFPRPPRDRSAALWRAGLPLIDHIHADSYGWAPGEKLPRVIAAMRALRPGITVFLTHCALPAPDDHHIAPGMPTRVADTDAMRSPALRGPLADLGIHTTTWRELTARRAAV